ncbi:MAG TPA: M67 family metallopeptidase [Symbiobacteriaceae bacterium]
MFPEGRRKAGIRSRACGDVAVEEPRLVIPRHLLQRIIEHCLEENPIEACGILTGRNGRVFHAYATDNSKRSPAYYEVDRAQQELVLQRAAEQGEEVVAIYHSHPTSPAVPSRTDIRMAVHYPDAYRVIVSLLGPTEVRAFLIRDGKVRNVKLHAPVDAGGEWYDLRGGIRRAGSDWPDTDGTAQ